MKRITALLASVALVLGVTGCNTTGATDGAVIGTALGAGLGAILGNQSGRAGEGALIGAGAGAIAGALTGNEVEKRRQRQYATPSQPVQAPVPVAAPPATGRYETRIVRTASGETYEERVWVPDR